MPVVLWWIGNIVLLVVVIPVLLFFLNKVLRPIFEINNYANDVLEHGVGLTGTLDCVPELITTCELTGACRLNVTRYGLALARMLETQEGGASKATKRRRRVSA